MITTTTIAALVLELDSNNLLPAIVFRSSRNQCDTDVERAGQNRKLHISQAQQNGIQTKIKEIMTAYDMDWSLVSSHPQYRSLITTGIGAHHAGQLLIWRLMLEELMAAGLLRVLVATGTVAAGVDFPARTVVITAHSRRGAEGFLPLTSAEFQQMSGRAGRRGKDTVGFCLAAPSPFCDARKVWKVSKKPAEPLVSAYFPSPSTVLNLLRYRTVDGLRYTVERSLAAYIDRRNAQSLVGEAREIEEELRGHNDSKTQLEEMQLTKSEKKTAKKARRLRRGAHELEQNQLRLLERALTGLSNLGYVEGVSLSGKGFWAANLCTSLVIELAEIIESGLLDVADHGLLVSVLASLSGDEHRTYLKPKTPPFTATVTRQLQEILNRIQAEGMPGIYDERSVLPDAAYTVRTWMRSETWQEYRGILLLSGVAEGDAARLITQTAEHLNQLARLGQSHPQLASMADEAKRYLLRPPLTEVINLET